MIINTSVKHVNAATGGGSAATLHDKIIPVATFTDMD